MKLKINKIALSLSTAFLMVSSIVSMATSAAATNEITVTADKSSAAAGDTINLSLGLSPDSEGVAGFTINLHYDPSKVSVHIPSDAELESAYNVNSKFSVIANYAATGDTIKIVGANLTGSNVTSETALALATFTVKDGATGDADYWIDVETMVKTSDDGYVAASYTAPTENAPFEIDLPDEVTTTTASSAVTTTTTEAATTKKSETTTTKKTTVKTETTTSAQTTTQAVTTAPEESAAEEVTQISTTTVKTETIKAPESSEEQVTTTTAAETEPVTTSETTIETTVSEAVTEPSDTTVSEEIDPDDGDDSLPEDTSSDDSSATESEPLFTHNQGEYDFNSEEALQYGFNLSDYITDYSKNYDIKVNIRTTGNVSGAVGMLVNDEWNSAYHESYNTAEDVWVYENLDPQTSSDLVYLQVYYLAANSDFEITSIEAVPVEETAAGENADESSDELTDVADDTAEDTAESEDISADDSENTAAISGSASVDEVVQAVDSAADKAQQSSADTANPNTGSKAGKTLMNILTLAAIAEIAFSIFTVIYNRFSAKKDEE